MRIYSMTATFGKLEHETLTLEPGLNIIDAPNEWGKSTWCAFLVTMLYGLDTRAKTTKATLADKERFAPWSGAPMSGRIDLCWQEKDITIERSSKGRTPLGVFKAYETESGLEIPELTATNCGQVLLGVERSVFTRSAFLRFSDLPVTQDDALRHRLNALVTTGDESGAAEALGQKLRDLKNRCRYNKSGLLPQAEAQQQELEQKINDYQALTTQAERTRNRLEELKIWTSQLENHKATLEYEAARSDASQLSAAAAALEEANQRKSHWEKVCADLPQPEAARQAIGQLDALHQDMAALQAREQLLPPMPPIPETPACFAGIRPDEATNRAAQDAAALRALSSPKKPPYMLMLVLAAIAVVAGAIFALATQAIYGVPLLLIAAGLMFLGWGMMKKYKTAEADVQNKKAILCQRYDTADPDRWIAMAQRYLADWERYEHSLALLRSQHQELDLQRQALQERSVALSGRSRGQWQEILSCWVSLEDAHRSADQALHHYQTLQSVVRTAPLPAEADELTYSDTETAQKLAEAAAEQQHQQHKLGQYLGQMEALGSRDALDKELDAVNRRIRALTQTNAALEQALDALTAARQELQRRFAPRITKSAQELFARLTGDRYDRLVLAEDLSIQAAAREEDILHSQQWRSDGTVDQLYLALRLAVARELIPNAPLVLDDALVRFDDTRLATALEILQQEAQEKQVILFTCQNRERALLEE